MKVFCVVIAVSFALSALPVPAQTPSPLPSPGVTPAAVFVPPADWVQVPRGFMLTELKNFWQGPKRGKGRGGLFAQAVLPIPAGLVGAGLTQLRNAFKKGKTPLNVATRSAKVCDATATVSTVRFGKGASAAILESTIFSKNGPTYATLYFRPSGPANSAIESAIRTACPLPNGDLPEASAPAGWTALGNGMDFEIAGLWLGNGPMQLMSLVQGHQLPPPELVADMFPAKIVRKKGQMQLQVTTKQVKFCGQPGVLINAQFNVPPGFGMSYSLAAVQGTAATYFLSYFHPADFNDPAAQQSLLTLCGGPPPTASPSPSASASPHP